MVWTTDLVLMVRYLIGDITSTTYSDTDLQKIIVIAAKLIDQDIKLATTYTISITDLTISPDPFSVPDNNFVALLSLKSACIIDAADTQTSLEDDGVLIAVGNASIQSRGLNDFIDLLNNGSCAAYEESLLQYELNNIDPEFVFSIMSVPHMRDHGNMKYIDTDLHSR